MKPVRDVMRRDALRVTLDLCIGDAEWLMLAKNVDEVAVHRGRTLVGILTTRDIASRANAIVAGTTVAEVMSHDVEYSYDDQDVDEAARMMTELGVRRLPVLDRENSLVGCITLRDVLRASAPKVQGALAWARRSPGPGRANRQSRGARNGFGTAGGAAAVHTAAGEPAPAPAPLEVAA